jgi:SAM-dependent methyltransferase
MAIDARVRNSREVLQEDAISHLFRLNLELVPQINEIYELQLAFYESRILTDDEIIRNGAYFARVGDRLTRHYLMCQGEPVRLPQHSSSRLRAFFQTNQFKTGYATHGLFPYRGKFHPQMVKGLLNAMGLKPGDTVLDPMMGSGTVLIEATLMGIRSIGIDASPFCRFMAQAKIDALTVPLQPLRTALRNSEPTFDHFVRIVGRPKPGVKKRRVASGDVLALMEGSEVYSVNRESLPGVWGDQRVRDVLMLAYLDSAGYTERSERNSPQEQFRSILERYLFVAEKIQRVLEGTEAELAETMCLEGDARGIQLEDESVNGILFSPPYSFAIDYLANDSFHLSVLGVNTEELRKSMVGLRGRTPQQKFDLYREDMARVLSECRRVLRPGGICTIVVGTNNNQLGRILGVAPEQVLGIDDLLIDLGRSEGLALVRKLQRQITGMANTMRTEYIVMLQRV